MAKKTKVTTLTVRNEDFDVFVDEYGQFHTDCKGQPLVSDTLDKLKERLTVAVRKAAVKLAIPVTRLVSKYGKTFYEAGVLTGIHAGTSRVLYRGEISGPEQIEGYVAGVFQPLSPEQIADHTKLRQASADAQRALGEWEEAYRLNPRKAVTEAIEAKENEGAEESVEA